MACQAANAARDSGEIAVGFGFWVTGDSELTSITIEVYDPISMAIGEFLIAEILEAATLSLRSRCPRDRYFLVFFLTRPRHLGMNTWPKGECCAPRPAQFVPPA